MSVSVVDTLHDVTESSTLKGTEVKPSSGNMKRAPSLVDTLEMVDQGLEEERLPCSSTSDLVAIL